MTLVSLVAGALNLILFLLLRAISGRSMSRYAAILLNLYIKDRQQEVRPVLAAWQYNGDNYIPLGI